MKKQIIFEKINNFWIKDFSKIKIRNKNINLEINTRKAISIIWPRRSWKTFTCFQIVMKLEKKWIPKKQIIYFNLEDERIKPFWNKDLNLILDVYFENYPENKDKKLYLFLDEIQEVDGWELFVRRILDETNINIIITWSSSKMLSLDIATSLRWRTIVYEVLPLSFSEVLDFNNLHLCYNKKYLTTHENYLLKHLFNDCIKYWFFPEIILEKDDDIKMNILKNYYDVIFYKDIVDRWNIKQIGKAKTFRRIITNYNTKLVSFAAIAEICDIEDTTCLNWYNLFESAYYVTDLKKFDFSLKIQEKSKRKLYLIDNWFYNSIFGYKTDNLWINFENIVFLELRKKWFIPNETLFYYQIDSYEIDFIVLKKDEIIPIQVSYDIENQKTFDREVRSLNKILLKHKNIENAYLIIPYKTKDYINKKWLNIIDFKKFILKF